MFETEAKVVSVKPPTSSIDVKIVDTTEKLNDLAKQLASAKVIAFDTETTSTEEMQADIVGISLAIKEGEGFYIPIGHLTGNNLPLEQVVSVLHDPLTNPRIPKSRTQCQIRLHRFGSSWNRCNANHFRYNDC